MYCKLLWVIGTLCLQATACELVITVAWEALPLGLARDYSAYTATCKHLVVLKMIRIQKLKGSETTPVDKKWVNSCVLKYSLFWGSSATKKSTPKPQKCSLRRATKVTFSKKERICKRALRAVLIDQLIRGQKFWEVVCFTGLKLNYYSKFETEPFLGLRFLEVFRTWL